MKIVLSRYASAWDARPTQPIQGTWAQFVEGLRQGLQHTTPEPKDDTDEAWRDAKESLPGFVCAAFTGRRRNTNSGPHTAIVIDVDHVPDESALIAKLERWRCVAYESPSSGCRGKGLRLRVCVALTEPVPPHAVKAARSAFARELGLDPRVSGVDKANAASQIMFLGRVGGTPERQLHTFDGKPWQPPAPGAEPPKRGATETDSRPRYSAAHVPDLTPLAEEIEKPGPDGKRRGGMMLMRGVGGYLARLGYHPDAIEAACAALPSDQPDVRAEQARSCAEQFYDGSDLAAGRTAIVDWFGEDVATALDWAVDGWNMRALERIRESWPPRHPRAAVAEASAAPAAYTEANARAALEAFPPWVRDHVLAAQEELRTPLDLNLANALGTVAAAISGNVKVRIRDNYTCHTCLFVCSVAGSGQYKSPAFRLAAAPIKAWVTEKQDVGRDTLEQRRMARESLESEIATLEGEWKTYGKDPNAPCAQSLREKRIQLEVMAPAVPFEFFTEDATPEALSDLLATHGRLACLSSEAAKIFNVLAGQYSKGQADLGVWLEAYDGEMKTVHRIGREAVKPRHAQTTISALLSIQPDVLDRITGNAAMVGEGLVQRMCWVVCPPSPPRWAEGEIAASVPQPVLEAWDVGVRALLSIPAGREVRLSEPAFATYIAWRDELEARQHEGDLDGEMKGWASKHLERTARIAAGLWACDGARGEISADQMQRAVALAQWLIPHAAAALQGEDNTADEQAILRWVGRLAGASGNPHAWVLGGALSARITPGRLRHNTDKVLKPLLRDLVGRGALEVSADERYPRYRLPT